MAKEPFMVKYAVVAGLAVILILAWVPDLDLACARLFYAGGHFIGDRPAGIVARDVAKLAPLLLFGGFLLLYVGARGGLVAARHAPDGRRMLFLALSLALGPGLLVNGVLKDEVHRPRPVQVSTFGGKLAFVPFYTPRGGCPRNCSFPSGEAAAAFWTVAPASLAALPLRPFLTTLALLFGLATGGLRMASGGHFLSDVLAAGVLILMVNAALRRLLLPSPRESMSRKN